MYGFKALWRRTTGWIQYWVRRSSLITRLCFAGVVIGIVPLVIVAVVAYVDGSRSILDKVSHATTQTIEQVSTVVGTNLQIIINDGIDVAYSDQVQKALVEYSSMSPMEKNRLKLNLSEAINKKYIYNSYDGEITLYTLLKERIDAYGPTAFRFIPKAIKLDELIGRMQALSGKPLWISVDAGYEQRIAKQVNVNRNSIVLARAIKSLATGEIIGYMTLRVDEKVISDLYRDLKISDNSELFILNSERTVISAVGALAAPSTTFQDEALSRRIVEGNGEPFEYAVGGQRYLVVYSPIRQADWYTVALIPTEYLYADAVKLLRSILLTSAVCGILAILLFALIAGSIVRPVHRLKFAMEAFGKRLYNPPVEEGGRDEIAMLTRGFNDMTSEITHLIDDIREKERQKRELEMRALQAQINPHFLANTLGTVAYMAKLKGEKNIEEMVRSIITLLSAVTKDNGNMITVREEMVFLGSYAITQEYRMMGRFRIQYQIEPEIEECLMPCFILQPIVENALIHGIEPADRPGLVVIKGYAQDSMLHFSVTDNGVGMSPEKIDRLMRGPDTEARRRMTGIGISNVQNRLQLMYGPPFGLTITSVENVFTTVEIVIPLRKAGDDM
jgi:two-component system sensor histidine kinase YesM